MHSRRSFLYGSAAAALPALGGAAASPQRDQDGGWSADGTPVQIYTLRSGGGLEASIMTYGGVVVSLKVPDGRGELGDVVLGFDNLSQYTKESPYFGALIGRYGNRIAHGRFTLDGVEYKLAENDHGNALHGGLRGFDKVVWKVRHSVSDALELTYRSKDGEEGYPGNLDVTVRYSVTGNELNIEYTAVSDKDTVVNLTNHSYFNLAGRGDILGHVLTIDAAQFTPVDANLIPTGELGKVEGTPMDFRQPTAIGARIGQNYKQLVYGGGYDHNWVFNPKRDIRSAAITVSEPGTGRVMEVITDQPGVQFYSGNFLDGTLHGKGGQVYGHRSGFCLETQHYPDSPNHPAFPSTVLKAGQRHHSRTTYRFRIAEAKGR